MSINFLILGGGGILGRRRGANSIFMGASFLIYPLTRNAYENNSLRIGFRNFEAILYPQIF